MNYIGTILSNLSFCDYVLRFSDNDQPMLRSCKSTDGIFHVELLTVLSAASSTLVDDFALPTEFLSLRVQMMDTGRQVDAVYIDLNAAFD